MSRPYSDVEHILKEARRERRQFDAFLLGYFHGMQDRDSEITFSSPDELRDRVEELFDSEVDTE